MKRLFVLLLVSAMFTPLEAQINLYNRAWKFSTGDNPAWAEPGFDDSAWKKVTPDAAWDTLGCRDYDGFAWYRLRVVIPSALKSNLLFGDVLRLALGKIDDADEVYLNGQLVGKTGAFPKDPGGYVTAWETERSYAIPVRTPGIRWDQENTLAIRMYDGGGQGGVAGKSFELRKSSLTDMLRFDNDSSFVQHEDNRSGTKSVAFHNSLNRTLNGSLLVIIQEGSSKKATKMTFPIAIKPLGATWQNIPVKGGERLRISYLFTENDSKSVIIRTEYLPYILTPAPPDKPVIRGPKVYGARPGRPFLYKIPATGEKPVRFYATGLPNGLELNAETGIITGTTPPAGDYVLQVAAINRHGKDQKILTIKAGDRICLTPPLGWNSWNCWGLSVSDEKVRASANALVASGLADFGWTYINIDDGWEKPERAPNGEIVTNEKFPDMKKLSDYVHSLGLKLGIYSSPGPLTCGGYLGSWQHEGQDARSYAAWGIDYLKYDWCSYDRIAPAKRTEADLRKPYLVMREALDSVGRDIVYSLCQYGMGDVWKWGASVGGNLWRTTGDITDSWQSMSEIGFRQDAASPFAGPGNWNDPDMLVVGRVGWGPQLHNTRLRPDEQYTHISLWALLSAPLLIGCDLQRLDAFTLNLLTNGEVLDINQDALGKQARKAGGGKDYQVWAKPLEGGGTAVGIFNLGNTERLITVNWKELGIKGYKKIRDAWRQKDVGSFGADFKTVVPPHGVRLLTLR